MRTFRGGSAKCVHMRAEGGRGSKKAKKLRAHYMDGPLHGLRKAFVKPQFYLFRPLPGADEGGSEGSTCIASGRRPVLVRFWQGLGARDCGGYV